MKKNKNFLSFLTDRKLQSILIFVGFFLIPAITISQQNIQQYTEISGAELESTIYQNHQSGVSGYQGLINNIEFKVEDFALLTTHFNEISNLLTDQFKTIEFYLETEENSLIVYYDKSKAGTKEFIKILKEVLYSKNILLVDYAEKTMRKI